MKRRKHLMCFRLISFTVMTQFVFPDIIKILFFVHGVKTLYKITDQQCHQCNADYFHTLRIHLQDSIHNRIKQITHKECNDCCKHNTCGQRSIFRYMEWNPAVIPIFNTTDLLYQSSQQNLSDTYNQERNPIIEESGYKYEAMLRISEYVNKSDLSETSIKKKMNKWMKKTYEEEQKRHSIDTSNFFDITEEDE